MTYYNYLGQAMAESADPATFIYGDSAGNETITAPVGPSGVSVNGGNFDTLIGSDGDNIFQVNNNTDVVQVDSGLSGVKTIVSFAGGYTLPDNVQNLTFYGAGNWGAGNTAANLIVMGGNDHATLDGGGGDDVLVGGFGQNDFQLDVGLGGGSHDVFYNFHSGTDTVRISGASFTSFAQIAAAMQQVGSDVVLTIDPHDSITFRDTTIASFQPSDFLMKLDTSQLGALTFSDDFTSLQLFNAATGTGNWQTNYGGDLTSANAYFIQGNDEKQLYTAPNFVGQDGHDLSAYSPFSINNGGGLTITGGQFSYADSQYTYGQAYYSGMLNTRGVFMQQYGYFDMKAELPTTLGSWPAFWLSQDPYKPGVEADVMEHLGMYPDISLSRSNDGGTVTGHTTYMPALSGFHDYGMLWSPTTTTFYIDDLAVLQVATPTSWDQPMYMLLDMALGGWGGIVDESSLPAQMQVQYVHVYGLANSPVVISEGQASYVAPDGVSSITLIGAGGQTVAANNTGVTLTSNDLGNTLIGGAGADHVVLGGGGDLATGGGGANTFSIAANPTVASEISDFSAADTVDLSALFTALDYTGSDAIADGVIKFIGSGHNAQIWAQANGQWSLLTTLDGVSYTHLAVDGAAATEAAAAAALPTPFSDFNHDGLSDATFRNPVSGEWGFMTLSADHGTWQDLGWASPAYAAIGPGDFNGDGVADMAFRNNANGDWGFMAVNSAGTAVWHDVGFSSPAYVAVAAGDFNGDGVTDMAFRDNATGDFGFMALDRSGNETWNDLGASSTAYTATVSGDFNGDGLSDIAFQNTATGGWGFMAVSSVGTAAFTALAGEGSAYKIVAAADFNGDGVTDVAMQNASTGNWGFMAMSLNGSETWTPLAGAGAGYTLVAAGDYNGDGIADAAFQNAATGAWGYMAMNNAGAETWHAVTSPTYAPIPVADFNGDGVADMAFRDGASGHWGYLALSPSGSASWHDMGWASPDYTAVASADFNGDGVPEMAFRNNTTGDFGFMTPNGPGGQGVWHGLGFSSPAYTAVGAGDFNGDHIADIAFRNASSGDWGFMAVNSAGSTTWTDMGFSSPAYVAAGAADFNGDHVADMAFRNNSTGDWGYMTTTPATGVDLFHDMGFSSPAYTAIGAADFNGDGIADMAFRNASTGDWGYMTTNQGTGVWHDVGWSSPAYAPIGAADFNGDHLADMAFKNPTTGDFGYMSTDQSWHSLAANTAYFMI
jgi:beta-glucanase (GH16 family)